MASSVSCSAQPAADMERKTGSSSFLLAYSSTLWIYYDNQQFELQLHNARAYVFDPASDRPLLRTVLSNLALGTLVQRLGSVVLPGKQTAWWTSITQHLGQL